MFLVAFLIFSKFLKTFNNIGVRYGKYDRKEKEKSGIKNQISEIRYYSVLIILFPMFCVENNYLTHFSDRNSPTKSLNILKPFFICHTIKVNYSVLYTQHAVSFHSMWVLRMITHERVTNDWSFIPSSLY